MKSTFSIYKKIVLSLVCFSLLCLISYGVEAKVYTPLYNLDASYKSPDVFINKNIVVFEDSSFYAGTWTNKGGEGIYDQKWEVSIRYWKYNPAENKVIEMTKEKDGTIIPVVIEGGEHLWQSDIPQYKIQEALRKEGYLGKDGTGKKETLGHDMLHADVHGEVNGPVSVLIPGYEPDVPFLSPTNENEGYNYGLIDKKQWYDWARKGRIGIVIYYNSHEDYDGREDPLIDKGWGKTPDNQNEGVGNEFGILWDGREGGYDKGGVDRVVDGLRELGISLDGCNLVTHSTGYYLARKLMSIVDVEEYNAISPNTRGSTMIGGGLISAHQDFDSFEDMLRHRYIPTWGTNGLLHSNNNIVRLNELPASPTGRMPRVNVYLAYGDAMTGGVGGSWETFPIVGDAGVVSYSRYLNKDEPREISESIHNLKGDRDNSGAYFGDLINLGNYSINIFHSLKSLSGFDDHGNLDTRLKIINQNRMGSPSTPNLERVAYVYGGIKIEWKKSEHDNGEDVFKYHVCRRIKEDKDNNLVLNYYEEIGDIWADGSNSYLYVDNPEPVIWLENGKIRPRKYEYIVRAFGSDGSIPSVKKSGADFFYSEESNPVEIAIETDGPYVVDTYPKNEGIVGTNQPTISIRLTDDPTPEDKYDGYPGSGIDIGSIKLYVNGRLIQKSTTGNRENGWQVVSGVTTSYLGIYYAPTLKEGINTVKITPDNPATSGVEGIRDIIGNPLDGGSFLWSFRVDSISPLVGSVSPFNMALISEPRPVIKMTLYDPDPDGGNNIIDPEESGINDSSIILELDGEIVSGWGYDVMRKELVYQPEYDLSDGLHGFRLINFKDKTGNQGTDTMHYFVIDTTTPRIVGASPSPNSTNIGIGTSNISISFSEPVARESIEGAVSIFPSDKISLMNPVWNNGDRTVTYEIVSQGSGLNWDTDYLVTIDTTVQDLAGNMLAEYYEGEMFKWWNFRTEKQPEIDLSGVDFRSAELAYLSTDLTNGVQFIIKAEKAQTGEPTINIEEKKDGLLKAFITGLVIPNYKLWVSLPMKWVDGKFVGDVVIDPVLAQTEVGRVMLDADVKMKFTKLDVMRQMENDSWKEWDNLVIASPYYNEIMAKGARFYPNVKYRTWIVPSHVTASGEAGKIFITDALLQAKTEIEEVSLDLSQYGFRSEVINDLNNRLITWKSIFAEKLRTVREPAITTSLNNDPEYDDIREIYASLAIAQWYKTQNMSGLLYRNLIDSNNITGLESSIPFNRDYWAGQAAQFIDSYTYTDPYGTVWSWTKYGGAILYGIRPVISPISQGEKDLVSNVLSKQFLQDGNTYYFGGKIKPPSSPDLIPVGINFSTVSPAMGDYIDITVLVQNQGEQDAGSFIVYFYDEYIYPNGYKALYHVGTQRVDSLSAGATREVSQIWVAGFGQYSGNHRIFAAVDYFGTVKESNERNNQFSKELTVQSPYPTAQILSPLNGVVLSSNIVTFTGSGYDLQDGDLPDYSLTWSNRYGELGRGKTLTVKLPLGSQSIFLTATDSKGYTDTERVNITIKSGPPVVKITSPVHGQVSNEGETVYFAGSAIDPEEGELPDENVIWTSDIDGELNRGRSFSTTGLSIGTHTIKLTATDSTGLSGEVEISIVNNTGKPEAVIHSPQNGSTFLFGKEIEFVGEGTDLQEGILPDGSLRWESNMNGYLGNGKSLKVSNLSPGNHVITLTVSDTTGLSDIAQVNIIVKSPQPPSASISSPRNGDTFINGDSITFKGQGTDPEDGILSGSSVRWTSNINGDIGTGNSFSLSNLSIGSHLITLTVTDSMGLTNKVSIRITINPAAPTAHINTPNHGEEFFFRQPVSFSGSGTDLQDGELSGSSLVWTSSLNGVIGNGASFTIPNLSSGAHIITLIVTNSYGLQGTDEISITIRPPAPPVASITSPSDGGIFGQEEEMLFTGSGMDLYEDGNLTGDSLVWISSINGEIGRGNSFSYAGLSIGTHTITFTATDSDGMSNTKSINLIIVAPKAELLNNLSDVSSKKEIMFDLDNLQTEYLMVPRDAKVTYATVDLKGMEAGERQISIIDLEDVHTPVIYGDRIVWRTRAGIFVYEISTLTTMQISASDQAWGPAIYGNKVVWGDYRNGNYDIYMYDLDTMQERQITTDVFDQVHPDIHEDKIVWMNWRDKNIYMYNLSTSTTTQITTSNQAFLPAIYEDKIVWEDKRNGNGDIYMYDLITKQERQISINPFYQVDLAIYGDKIVWWDWRNRQNEIYIYEISTSTEKRITYSLPEYGAAEPDIYGDRIVWSSWNDKGEGTGIFMYDFSNSTTVQITNNEAWEPAIYDDKIVWIVWTDYRTARGRIYMYDLSVPMNPTLDVGNDGDVEWSYQGEFNTSSRTEDFASELNEYLDRHKDDAGDEILVPLVFHSDSSGRIEISNINIQYQIIDATPPIIEDVVVTPNPARRGDVLNISARVTDNIELDVVEAKFDGSPILFTFNSASGKYEGVVSVTSAGMVEISTMDKVGLVTSIYVDVTLISNKPLAEITAPAEGESFTQGEPIVFTGRGIDDEDGELAGDSLVWVSSRDGIIGVGSQFTVSNLSIGTHTLTLTVTDSDGMGDEEGVNIIVVAPQTQLLNSLSDGTARKYVLFDIGMDQTEYLRIPKDAKATYATMDLKGMERGEKQTTIISSENDWAWAPDIYENKIVWWGEDIEGGGIFLYDLATSTQEKITAAIWYDLSIPKIYGDKVVWAEKQGSTWGIYLYDISNKSKRQIIPDVSLHSIYPDIYGDRIIWWGYGGIFMYDLLTSTISQITDSGPAGLVTIYGDRIIWRDNRIGGNNWNIYMYDFSIGKETQITDYPGYKERSSIYGDKIVWMDYRNGNGAIYMYDLVTEQETMVIGETSVPYNPAIYGNRVVYEDYRDGDYYGHIYMYDLSTGGERQITTEQGYHEAPAVYGNRIVWADERNWAIYMYDLSVPTNPSLDAGNGGDVEWSYQGEFNTSVRTEDFASELNEYLDRHKDDADDEILVPLVFHSDSAGRIEVSNINIQYQIIPSEMRKADLAVDPSGVSIPDDLSDGNRIVLEAMVHNYGDADAEDFEVELVVDETVKMVRIVSIPANSSSFYSFIWDAEYGEHTIGIRVDSTDMVVESNEENNYASRMVTVSDDTPPEIEKLEFPEPVYEGEPITLKAYVTDNAGVDSVEASLGESFAPLMFNPITGLYEGTILLSTAGIYPIEVTAIDIEGLVASLQTNITVRSLQPDIAVVPGDISFSPSILSDGGDIAVDVLIHNYGKVDVDDLEVEFMEDGSSVQVNTLSIKADSSDVTMFIWHTTYGSHILSIVTDPRGVITESDESNNIVNRNVFVPDNSPPVIHSVSLPEAIYENEVFNTAVKVTDNVEVNSVVVNLEDEIVSFTYNQDTLFYEGYVTAPSAGEYILKITATDTNGLRSSNSVSFSVTRLEPDLTVDISLSPQSISEDNPLTIEANIHNTGKKDAGDFDIILTIDGVVNDTNTVSLPAGGSEVIRFIWDSVYGEHRIGITVDPNDQILESDESNNEKSKTIFVSDITPPSSPVPSAEPDGWTTMKTHTISWQAVSDKNGIAGYEYQIDSGNWVNPGGVSNFVTPILPDGIHTIYVRAIDVPGNVSAPGAVNIYIDTEPPNVPQVNEEHCGQSWTTHDSPNFTWQDPGDRGSGVSSYKASIDGGNPIDIGNVLSYHPTLGSGERTFRLKAIDALGQESEWSNTVVVKIDLDPPPPPVITSPTHPDQSVWYSNNTPLWTWAVPVDVSGIAGYYYVIDRSPDTIPTQINLWTNSTSISAPLTEGIWFMHIIAQDGVGHISNQPSSFMVRIDTSYPITTDNAPSNWQVRDWAITLSASDAYSGVKSTRYKSGNSDWQEGDSVTINTEGEHNLQYYSIDNANNIEPVHSIQVLLDKTPPVINYETNPQANQYGWNNTDVTVTFNASDTLSGIESVSSPVTITSEGKGQTVTGSAKDMAGNTGSITCALNIDKTPPVTSPGVSPVPNEAGWNKTLPVTVDFQVFDNLSGPTLIPDDVILNSEGVHRLDYHSTDLAGNMEDLKTAEVKIDITPPIVKIVEIHEIIGEELVKIEPEEDGSYIFHNINPDTGQSNLIKIIYTSEDPGLADGHAGSGISGISYLLNEAVYENPDEGVEGEIILDLYDLVGDNIFTIEAEDNAGNIGSYLLNFSVTLIAGVIIKPESLDINPGIITAYVTFPEGYDVAEIDGIDAEVGPFCDGAVAERMMLEPDGRTMVMKFRREDIELLDEEFEVYGTFGDGMAEFEGWDVIMKVIW